MIKFTRRLRESYVKLVFKIEKEVGDYLDDNFNAIDKELAYKISNTQSYENQTLLRYCENIFGDKDYLFLRYDNIIFIVADSTLENGYNKYCIDCISEEDQRCQDVSGRKSKKNISKTPKAKNQVRHARRRFLQREKISFDEKARRDAVQQIQQQKAVFIKRQSNNRTIWKIKIDDSEYVVVYDKRTKNIVTVLSDNAIKDKEV